jgi:hypothetical protein
MMSTFEFVSVLISIVVGIGLTHLLTGVGQALEHRRKVRFFWVQGLWVVNVGLIFVSFWWATLFSHADRVTWYFPNFVVLLVYAVLGDLAAVLIVPSNLERSSDLEAHFFEVRPWFFTIAAFIPPLELTDTLLHGGIHRLLGLGPFYLTILLVSEACCIVGAWTANRRSMRRGRRPSSLAMSAWMVAGFWSIG